MTIEQKKNNNHKLLVFMLVVLASVLVINFIWIPWYKELRIGLQLNRHNRNLLESRSDSIAHSESHLLNWKDILDAEWKSIHDLFYTGPSINKITTELISNLQIITSDSQVNLLSMNLLITEDLAPFINIGVEMRITGSSSNIVTFLNNIANTVPVHKIERMQVDVRQEQVYLDTRIEALAFISEEEMVRDHDNRLISNNFNMREQIDIFRVINVALPVGQEQEQEETIYESNFRLVGLIFGSDSSVVLLRHDVLGIEYFAREGDVIEGEYVKEIGSNYVILTKGNDQIVLWSQP